MPASSSSSSAAAAFATDSSLHLDPLDPAYAAFSSVFQKFQAEAEEGGMGDEDVCFAYIFLHPLFL